MGLRRFLSWKRREFLIAPPLVISLAHAEFNFVRSVFTRSSIESPLLSNQIVLTGALHRYLRWLSSHYVQVAQATLGHLGTLEV